MTRSAPYEQSVDREFKKDLDEQERMELVGADRGAFLAAVLNPPEPTESLVAALRRHRPPFSSH